MFKLAITKNYEKKAKQFFKYNQTLLPQYEKCLELLCLNPKHPSLRLHKLSGKLSGLFSISVNMSVRVLIYFIIKEDLIVPVDIGSHDKIY
jgi:proteic killer suppression protein